MDSSTVGRPDSFFCLRFLILVQVRTNVYRMHVSDTARRTLRYQ